MTQPPPSPAFQKDNLVLYRSRPARITGFTGQKIGIETKDGTAIMVRPSDISPLHPGPAGNLRELPEAPQPALVEEVCELLDGEAATLQELAELLYGNFSPSSAWSAYALLADGIYFTGTVDRILPRSSGEYRKELATRCAQVEEKKVWEMFIGDIRKGVVAEDNRFRLASLEDFALGKTAGSVILKELAIAATPENAHKLLLKLSRWDAYVNPYPSRLHVAVDGGYPVYEPALENERLDLTHLPAFAIDDEGNKDPDDAVSIEGDRLWIHIADVASSVWPDSPADLHARNYGATRYLPERTVTMLAQELTAQLGLGLQPVSPALSFCVELDASGSIADVAVHLTQIAVTRLTYNDAEELLDNPFFSKLDEMTSRYRANRIANHAVMMNFPEVRIRTVDNIVSITPLPATKSRLLVAESMMMAGEGAALFSQKHGIPFPYNVQPPPEAYENPATLAAMVAYRKKLKPSQIQSHPGVHAGLGIGAYSRATSPLRRYIDLVAHQQLRAFLLKTGVMDELTITNRIGAYNAVIGTVQKLERLSNMHWTLVYLLQHPGWSGSGIVVDKTERYSTILIPELAFETRVSSPKNLTLDSVVKVTAGGVDIAELSVHFMVG